MSIRLPERNNTFSVGEKVKAVDLNDTLDALVSKERTFTDGIIATQTTDNADVAFGQNDATTKRLKLAQSFLATKTTVKSVTFKKGTPVPYATAVTSDSTCSTFTYSESDTNANWSDGGVVSSARRIPTVANYWYGADFGKITKSLTGLVAGKQHTLNVDIAGNFGTSGSAFASMNCDIIVDGVILLTVQSGSAGTFATKTVNWTPTGTTATIEFKLHTYAGGYNQSASANNFDFKNFSVTYLADTTGDVTVKVYSDNGSDAPSATLVGSVTITNAVWLATANNATIKALFSSFLSGLYVGSKYWVVLENTSPDANKYLTVRKNTAGGYTDGSAKYYNATDGWTAETGDLYFIVEQDDTSIIPLTNSDGKIQGRFLALNVYGDGSDGDVTISSGTTTLTRDMFYNNLTVSGGATLKTNGYRVYVKGTLTNSGTIHNDGGDGGNGTSSTGSGGAGGGGSGGNGGVVLIFAYKLLNYGTIGARGGKGGNGANGIDNNGGGGSQGVGGSAGTAGAGGTLPAGVAGKAGGGGNTAGTAGTSGTNSIQSVAGVAGGASGSSSGSGTNAGGSASGASTPSLIVPRTLATMELFFDGVAQIKPNQSSNGSGAGSPNANYTGTTPQYVSGGAGGGAGGNGGVVGLVYSVIINTGTISVAGGLKGTKGLRANPSYSTDGQDGNNGVDGLILTLQL